MQSDRVIVCIGIFVGTKVVYVVHICLIVGGPLRDHAGCPCAESIAAAELIGVECATRAETIVAALEPRGTVGDYGAVTCTRRHATAIRNLDANGVVDAIDVADVVPVCP